MFFIVRLIINMVAILIISYLFPKMIWVDGFLAALVAAFLLGIVNTILRPILVLLTLPLTVLTLWQPSLKVFMSMVSGARCWVPF
jgi:putative membrane protein